MKTCLVDSRVDSIFLTSVKDGVTAILLDYEIDSFESILTKINSVGPIESIAYVAYGTFCPTYSFFKNISFDMKVKESWQPFFNFLTAINGLQYFDFLGCSLALHYDWKQVFSWIEETGVQVRASTDASGNLSSGNVPSGNVSSGDNWILEDGFVDAKALYFTNIDNFERLSISSISINVSYGSYHTIVFILDNTLWACGYNCQFDFLMTQINSFGSIELITYVAHGTFGPTYSLFEDSSFNMKVKESWQPFFEFLLGINGLEYFDFLGCSILSNDWKQVFLWMEEMNINVTSSNSNVTSNINWILDDGLIDTKALYIINLYNFKGLLSISNHTVIIKNNTVFACGSNYNGQLGNNQLGICIDSTSTFTQMVNISNSTPIKVSYGNSHTVVLMSDHTLWACGDNSYGQLGNNTNVNMSTPNYILTQMVNTSGSIPIQISCGGMYTVVLMSNHTLWACGYNWFGQLGNGTIDNTSTLTQMIVNTNYNPVHVSCGSDHTVVLMSDHTLWACGYNGQGQLGNNINVGTDIQNCILTQIIINTLYHPIYVSCGIYHTVVLMSDNSGIHTLWACGMNKQGQLGNNINVNTYTPNYVLTQMNISYGTRMPIQISCGGSYNIVLMTDNTLWACGDNYNSQLGINTGLNDVNPHPTLIQIFTGSIPIAILSNRSHTILLTIDNNLLVCGYNCYGQLGISINDVSTFTQSISNVQYISDIYPTITLTIPTKKVGDIPFTLAPLSNSNGTFSYTSNNPSVAIIIGSTVTIIGAGTSTIIITQARYGDYVEGYKYITLTVNSSAGAHGDPYIATFNGFQYKLPNIVRTYRLLEYDDIVVNATVSELTNKEKDDMRQWGLNQGINKMIYGFFFEFFYIGSRTGYVIFDRQLHIVEQNGNFEFRKGKGVLNCPVQGISRYKSIILHLNDATIFLKKYKNPQILNGIDISVTNITKAKGLLNSLCNPKSYSIKKIKNVKPLNVIDNTIYSKKVKEVWVKIK